MRMGITELAVKLRKREISAVELTKAYIDAIEKLNPTLNAYVHLTFDTALEAAEQADQMLKEDDAPLLCGIPMALKDNICTDGIPTTCCSKILEGFKPYYDATVWERLKNRVRFFWARPTWTNSAWEALRKPVAMVRRLIPGIQIMLQAVLRAVRPRPSVQIWRYTAWLGYRRFNTPAGFLLRRGGA